MTDRKLATTVAAIAGSDDVSIPLRASFADPEFKVVFEAEGFHGQFDVVVFDDAVCGSGRHFGDAFEQSEVEDFASILLTVAGDPEVTSFQGLLEVAVGIFEAKHGYDVINHG